MLDEIDMSDKLAIRRPTIESPELPLQVVKDGQQQYTTVLEIPPVDSARTAVQGRDCGRGALR